MKHRFYKGISHVIKISTVKLPSCPPQQGHPGIFSLLLTKNTVCLIANKRILCYNEHGFYQISEYATVQEGALGFFLSVG